MLLRGLLDGVSSSTFSCSFGDCWIRNQCRTTVSSCYVGLAEVHRLRRKFVVFWRRFVVVFPIVLFFGRKKIDRCP